MLAPAFRPEKVFKSESGWFYSNHWFHRLSLIWIFMSFRPERSGLLVSGFWLLVTGGWRLDSCPLLFGIWYLDFSFFVFSSSSPWWKRSNRKAHQERRGVHREINSWENARFFVSFVFYAACRAVHFNFSQWVMIFEWWTFACTSWRRHLPRRKNLFNLWFFGTFPRFLAI